MEGEGVKTIAAQPEPDTDQEPEPDRGPSSPISLMLPSADAAAQSTPTRF